MKTKKSIINIINYFIIALSAVILISFVLFDCGISGFVSVFQNINFPWVVCGILLMLLFWGLEASSLHVAVLSVHKPFRFRNTFKTTILGQYYNSITPPIVGGQPMQAYYLYNSGVPVGAASSALLVHFLVYQCSLTLYSTVVIILRYSFFAEKIPGFSALIFVGFAVNAALVLLILGVAFTPKLVLKFFRLIIGALTKIRLIKDKEKALLRVEFEIDKFYQSLKAMKYDVKSLIKMVLLSLLQMTVYFMVPYCVLAAFGVYANPLVLIPCSLCVLLISSFVPLPGAAGGAEGSFLLFFGLFGLDNKMSAAILLWRILTLYMPIIIGIFFAQRIGGAREREEKAKLINKAKIIEEIETHNDN
ncbi:MAG: hypothetical protein DBX47_02460 [Clostridiales bacterium]|nr:MAG: hypothetical protein DBX47_02460 [Clostridiales bacterium]